VRAAKALLLGATLGLVMVVLQRASK
jgi:hypothetical protein